jgi:maltose alpha-D-glucosyltransferase/alpha-amylase
VQIENVPPLLPFARIWVHYITGFFMKAYLETVSESMFIPKDKKDLQMLLDTYLLDMAVYDLKDELSKKSDAIIVPIRTINAIIKD